MWNIKIPTKVAPCQLSAQTKVAPCQPLAGGGRQPGKGGNWGHQGFWLPVSESRSGVKAIAEQETYKQDIAEN